MIKVIDNEKKVTTEWFGDLDVGDTFILDGKLYIKSDKIQNRALNLSLNGDWEQLNEDLAVVLVDIEIKIIRGN